MRSKWEAYCGTNVRCTAAFPFLQSLEASEAQRYKRGGVLRCKLEVYRQYFSDKLYGLGVPKHSLLESRQSLEKQGESSDNSLEIL